MRVLAAVVLLGCSVGAVDWEAANLTGYAFFPRSSFGADVGDDFDTAYFFGGVRLVNFTQAEFFNDLVQVVQTPNSDSLFKVTKIPSNSTSKPSNRAHTGMAVSGNYILVAGGVGSSNGVSNALTQDVCWLFKRDTSEWINVTENGPPPFSQAAVVGVKRIEEKFYIYGGLDGFGNASHIYWELNPETRTWSYTEDSSTDSGRFGAKGIMVGTELSYFYGGISSLFTLGQFLSNIVTFNGMDNGTVLDQEPDALAPKVRLGGFTSIDADGDTFLLTGGTLQNGTNECIPTAPRLLANPDTYTYDRSTNTWSLFPTQTALKYLDGAALFFNQSVVWFGGYSFSCPGGQVYLKHAYQLALTSTSSAAPTPDSASEPVSTPAPVGGGGISTRMPTSAPTGTSGAANWLSTQVSYSMVFALGVWVLVN